MDFVLQPCKVRSHTIVATKEAPRSCSWAELLELLGASARKPTFLGQARQGGYLGVRTTAEGPSVFYLETPNGSGSLQGVLDEEAAASIRLVFRVVRVTRRVTRYEAIGETPFVPVYENRDASA